MASKKKYTVSSRLLSAPARSRLAVNKSIVQIGQLKNSTSQQQQAANADKDKRLDEIFAETLEIAVALLPTVAFMCRFQ